VLRVLCQVALTLAVAEEACRFEHRDLHWGNLLIRRGGPETGRWRLRWAAVCLSESVCLLIRLGGPETGRWRLRWVPSVYPRRRWHGAALQGFHVAGSLCGRQPLWCKVEDGSRLTTCLSNLSIPQSAPLHLRVIGAQPRETGGHAHAARVRNPAGDLARQTAVCLSRPIAEANRIQLVIFGIQNRTLGPYLAPTHRTLISAMRPGRGVDVEVATGGLEMTLIDFTLSRLDTPSGGAAFCDLSADPEIFQGPKGDCQVSVCLSCSRPRATARCLSVCLTVCPAAEQPRQEFALVAQNPTATNTDGLDI
jgi:Haspin like kinase domain